MISRLAILLSVVVTVSACADHRQTFTPDMFNVAKARCAATEAFISKSDPKTIILRGTSPDNAAKARCLMEQLKGTDARMIGFISEPPR